jgi:hypothetical protein
MIVKDRRPRRPSNITLLAILFLFIALLYLARLMECLAQWAFLNDLLPFSPAYLALTGLVWGFAGVALAFALWFGLCWAPRFTAITVLVYSVYYWMEYTLLVDHDARTVNWPFLAVVNLVALLWIFWVLSRPRAKYYFGEYDE